VSPFVLAALVVAVVGGFVALAYWRRWEWTGLPAAAGVGEGGVVERPAKTLWDWLQLLGIPVVLATLAFLLNEAQSSRDHQREDRRAAQQHMSATDVERENTLRTYLAQMADLMLDRRLLRSKPEADVREVARTATLTAVRRLDGARRGLVVRFLAEAQLLRSGEDSLAAVDVASADFRGANLRYADLFDTNLRRADLSGSDLAAAGLSGAFLPRADLGRANLFNATLRGAYLLGVDLRLADLRMADLFNATLRGADLREADLRGTFLIKADLFVAKLREANLVGADLGKANLSKADLVGADLRKANLSGADLSRADLRGADLRGADLRGADLRGARGVDLTNSKGKPAHGP
jgi:uncharacterized protein YjbI with pentapeptide repeats